MDLFDVLNLIGGLSLFLFGMTLMGQALERIILFNTSLSTCTKLVS